MRTESPSDRSLPSATGLEGTDSGKRVRPIRVMELRSTYRWGGGPDKTILNSARLHDPSVVWTLLVYLRSDWDNEFVLADRARKMGLNIVEIVESRVIDWAAFRRIVSLVGEQRIDVIHSRDYKSNLYALLAKTFFHPSVRIVTTAHGWVGSGLKLKCYYTLDKLLVASFDRNFILFRSQTRDFIHKPKPHRTVVIHNAIDPEEWRPDSRTCGSFRREIGVDRDKLLVGYVGRIMPEKDILTMVRVADEIVHQRRIPAVFVLVGESKSEGYDKAVRAAVAEHRLEHSFRLLGKRDNTKYVYQDLDIFLMTSLQEGFPNSLLEAMAMGVPSVVSAVDGIPEILEDGKNGWICPPGDAAAFAGGIQQIVDDPACSKEMADRSRAKVERELSFARRLRKMEREYLRLMNGREGVR